MHGREDGPFRLPRRNERTDDDLARRLRDLLGKDPTEADLADAGAMDGDDLPGEEA